MPTWSVAEIVQQTQGALIWGEPQRQVHGVSTDSRTVPAGALFVALRGSILMGISLLPRPCNAVQPPSYSRTSGVPDCQSSAATSAGIHVADTRELRKPWPSPSVASFLARFGDYGSNGKTTVKGMTAAVLNSAMPHARL